MQNATEAAAMVIAYVQGEKESLSVAIIDEFYTFDLMGMHLKNFKSCKIDLDLVFQG